MNKKDHRALELCEVALQFMWEGDVEGALATYDRALGLATSEESRELITIRKAEALIAAELTGPEVAALPGIVMRRRSPRHVYLAAYALMRRHSESDDRKRAQFYGEIALKATEQLDERLPRANVLNGLGVLAVVEARYPEAIALFERGLAAAVLNSIEDRIDRLRAVLTGNLGGAKILHGQTVDGIKILTGVLPKLDTDEIRTEAYLDLCYGHVALEEYAVAEEYALRALDSATLNRQVRNAHHLLGEICMRNERYREADRHFNVVASFYPEFDNVKQLLVEVDLCDVVNWKA